MTGHAATVQRVKNHAHATCSCGSFFDAYLGRNREGFASFVRCDFSKLVCVATLTAWRRLKALPPVKGCE